MDNAVHNGTREILRMNQDVVSMPEVTFVKKWLLTLREYIAGGEVNIAYWLSENNITHFAEVAIVDSIGTELYRVPSILAKADKVLPTEVTSNISDIMYRADGLNRIIPGKGDAFINNELTSQVIENTNIGSYHERWDAIFTRYQLDPVFNVAQATSTSTGTQSEEFDDDDEL